MLKNQTLSIVIAIFSIIPVYAMEPDRELEIHNAVSFIYYPSAKLGIAAGHVEIEEEGISWTLLGDVSLCSNRTLDGMIQKSTSNGMPFFRFVFKADDAQITAVQKAIDPSNGSFPCTHGALAPLAKARLCSVPLPFSLSPN